MPVAATRMTPNGDAIVRVRLLSRDGERTVPGVHADLDAARRAWNAGGCSWGLMWLAADPCPEPPPWQHGSGRLLASRELAAASVGRLRTVDVGIHGLPWVNDASFLVPGQGEVQRPGPLSGSGTGLFPGGPAVKWWTSLSYLVPADNSRVRRVLGTLHASTAGDLAETLACDLSPADASAVRSALGPWFLPPPDKRGGPLLDAPYPDWFLEADLAEVVPPGDLSRLILPCRRVGDLAGFDAGAVAAGEGFDPGSVAELRRHLADAFAGMAAERPCPPQRVGGSDEAPRYCLAMPLAGFIAGLSPGLPGTERATLSAAFGIGMPAAPVGAALLGAALDEVESGTGAVSVLRRRLGVLREASPVPAADVLSEPWTSGMPVACLETLLGTLGGLSRVDPIPGMAWYWGQASEDWEATRVALMAALPGGGGRDGILGRLRAALGTAPGTEGRMRLAEAVLASGGGRAVDAGSACPSPRSKAEAAFGRLSWTSSMDQAMLALAGLGMTYQDIAPLLDARLTKNAVCGRMDRLRKWGRVQVGPGSVPGAARRARRTAGPANILGKGAVGR